MGEINHFFGYLALNPRQVIGYKQLAAFGHIYFAKANGCIYFIKANFRNSFEREIQYYQIVFELLRLSP